MHSVKRRVACFCQKTFEADIPDSADLSTDAGLEELIASGDFMAVTCPACGKRLTPEFPFRLTLRDNRGDLFMVPEADRNGYVRGSLAYPVGDPYRVAVGFPELAEKVLVIGRGLDDRVIEIMKYYLLTGTAEQDEQEQDRDVTLRYKGEEEGKHVFHVIGLKEGEIGVARLAREIYLKIAGDVDTRVEEEPFRDFCSPPWVSIRRLTGGAA